MLSLLALLSSVAISAAHEPLIARGSVARSAEHGGDSSDAVAVVDAFRTALARGDSAAALQLLAPDVVILESGDVETLAGYRGHHLAADIEFSRAMPGTHTIVHASVEGNAAWVSSTSVSKGRFKGRPIDSAGAELMVLSRASAGAPWRIRAIHWSSHRRSA